MYLNIGQDTVLKTEDIIGIFDMDNTTVNKASRDFLAHAEKTGAAVTVSYDLPKSFLVTKEKNGKSVYISPLAVSTIYKRMK